MVHNADLDTNSLIFFLHLVEILACPFNELTSCLNNNNTNMPAFIHALRIADPSKRAKGDQRVIKILIKNR